jgi:hypothetical protein
MPTVLLNNSIPTSFCYAIQKVDLLQLNFENDYAECNS